MSWFYLLAEPGDGLRVGSIALIVVGLVGLEIA
jgi:hypothetical protein